MSEQYLIGDLAERAKVTQRTIRYYESLGLLHPQQAEKGKYRYYDDVQLDRLLKITRMKDAGLTLEQISEIIDLLAGDDPNEVEGKRQILAILQERLDTISTKISSMELLRAELKANIAQIQAFLSEED